MAYDVDEKNLQELQVKSLKMAEYFVKFCRENGLLCYLCGGGCIGAVRHKGFIPWDDDLDFFMPRPDYEKLLKIWDEKNQDPKYSIQFATDEIDTKNQFATICDNDTTYIKSYMADLDINHGLSLDIIPLDGRPPLGKLFSVRRKLQIIWALIYSISIVGEAPTNHGGLVKACGKLFLAVVNTPKKRYKLWRLAERKMSRYDFYKSQYIAELTTGPVYMKRDYPASMFKSAVLFEFENTKMPIPVGYDEYLTMAFGNYLKLPPKDEQKPHHDFEFIDMSKSYVNYKGEYYCTDNSNTAKGE